MGSDLVRSSSSPAVREARIALQEAPLDEIKEIHDRAVAAEAYAKAKEHREAYLAAGEIKLWAERSAGAVRKDLPRVHGIQPRFDRDEARRLREQGLTQRQVGERLGVDKSAIGYAERNNWGDGIKGVPLKEFDENLGVASGTAYNWEKLSEIPDDRFAELIEDAKQADAALTAVGILRRDGKSYEKRVAPGIYRIRDGRLALRWQKNGVPHMKVLKHGDLPRARAALARARGTVKEPVVRVGSTVSDGYALVRRALQALDKLDTKEFDLEAKDAVNRAIAALHKAEDELVIASGRVSRRRAA